MGPADPAHPPAEDLRRFMHGELKRSEVRELVRHLLTGCPQCLEVTRRLWDLGERSFRLLEAISAAGSGAGSAERVQRKVRVV
jgi:hypothetical protein